MLRSSLAAVRPCHEGVDPSVLHTEHQAEISLLEPLLALMCRSVERPHCPHLAQTRATGPAIRDADADGQRTAVPCDSHGQPHEAAPDGVNRASIAWGIVDGWWSPHGRPPTQLVDCDRNLELVSGGNTERGRVTCTAIEWSHCWAEGSAAALKGCLGRQLDQGTLVLT